MLKNITVAFPGLGIDGGEVNSVAFSLGENFSVMWYGVVIALGMLMAIAYACYRCKQHGIKIDDLVDIAIFTIFFGVIGARLYYVAFNPTNFKTLGDILNLRSGGLAIYGGIIAGALTIVVVCLIKKISWLQLFDCAGPGVMLAQAMGRWGNFFNGEAYGSIVEEGHPLYFLRMGLISSNTYGDFGTSQMVYVHPCFLYESLWNILGFVLINLVYKKKKFDGQNALYYIAWYGFGRMFIEGLRTDALYIGQTGIRVSQLLGFLLFAIATALIIMGLIYVKNHPDSKLARVGGVAPVSSSDEEDDEEETEETEEETEEDGEDN